MLKKYLIKGLFAFVILLILIGGRVFYLQTTHFQNAEEFFQAENWKLAIREYDHSMHFYVPLSPYTLRSAQRLWEIGERFEADGRLKWASLAYGSIRSSLYATRSLFTPYRDWIAKCDEKLVDLNVGMLIEEGSLSRDEADEERAKLLYVLQADRAPKPPWAFLVEFSFFGWIGSVLCIIFKGFDDKGRMKGKAVLIGGASFMFSFALWILAMYRA